MDKLHSLLADNIKAVLDYKGHVKQCGCKMIFFNDEIANLDMMLLTLRHVKK